MAKLTKARPKHDMAEAATNVHIQQPQPVALPARGFDFQFPSAPHPNETSTSSVRSHS